MKLPNKVELEVSPDVDIDQDGADLLSEKYEWLVQSFDYEVIEETADHKIVLFTDIKWDKS